MAPAPGWFLPSRERGIANERKFAGDALAQPLVVAMLDAALPPDGLHPADRVNSVYFDTHDLRGLAEKENGDNLKTKIRLRWYGRPGETAGDVPAFLEAKHRVGAARRKV
ncbi:MAG: VTC domain-containing protein, partial [Kiritimatiellae bacterium]|nr:VTC domain-containing protein [Kiritimatiellia bacterium]